MVMMPWSVSRASNAISTLKTNISTAMSPVVTRGRRRIRRSKSTRRESSMSEVMRSGRSTSCVIQPSPSAALAGVEHHAEGEPDAPVQDLLGIAGEVEDVPVEDGELPVELTEDDAGRPGVETDEDEVRPQETEQRPEDASQQRQHDRVLDGHRGAMAGRRLHVPALAKDVVDVFLAQPGEREAAGRHHRVGPGEDGHPLILPDAEEDFTARVVAEDGHVTQRPGRYRD